MKRNVYVGRFKFRCNILVSGKIIKELPGLVGSGTHYMSYSFNIFVLSTADKITLNVNNNNNNNNNNTTTTIEIQILYIIYHNYLVIPYQN
jgi:hypothetical protein